MIFVHNDVPMLTFDFHVEKQLTNSTWKSAVVCNYEINSIVRVIYDFKHVFSLDELLEIKKKKQHYNRYEMETTPKFQMAIDDLEK